MIPEILEALTAERGARRLAVLATRLPDGRQMLLSGLDDRLHAASGSVPAISDATHAALARAASAAAASDRSQMVRIDDADWFLHVHAPPPRLLIVGAVHIAQVLAPLARSIDFAVSVIDPRASFATEARFPEAELVALWPDEALRSLAVDRHSAIVTLTHDPKLDDPALDVALRSPAFYIGALGSRKTQQSRRGRLRDLGFDDQAIGRLRGPAGLAIGAIGAAEIALSILAEIVAVRRGGPLAGRSGWTK